MTFFKKYILPASLVLALFIPAVSHAALAPTTQTTMGPGLVITAQVLSAELTNVQNELAAGTTTTASFTLSPGQSIQQSASSTATGVLNLSLPTFEHTQITPITELAKITLQYMPCVAASPSVCLSMASSSYPAVNSDLELGQSTTYLNYNVALTSLGSTTAVFTVTDNSFLTSIQNQINAISVKVHALIGN